MIDLTSLQDTNSHDVGRGTWRPIFQRPEEVLSDPKMSCAEKRALLASWASDAHAVPGAPSMRQLEDGSLVKVDEILQALKALDAGNDLGPASKRAPGLRRRPPQRRSRSTFRNWTRIVPRRRRDDDDDPPPCPVSAAIRPRTGGGGAFVYPDPALA